ncbi:heavy-metal-associated domain-containing protein [Cryptosporangium sp. NPDC051539]|uniref:heavy-metal-associated domain-containing protein n=1 Tax=Cryptosporangium sp. NPDC051539 TaxID=3363962 RepID=UPI0037AC3837
MTCQHCVDAVRAEVSEVSGVTGVDVDLTAGAVTVTSAVPVAFDALRAAVDEAGYVLA